MTVYAVIGNMGSGKSLVCVGRIRDALEQGRRVATNLDLRLEHLTLLAPKSDVTRIRDWPTLADFESLGWGSKEARDARPGQAFDENRNGVMVLDEISSILGNREWQGKERAGLIDWLKQSRKRGWDIYFIVQHESMIDVQVKKALFELYVICRRLDRIPIPLIGWLIRAVGLGGKLPRVHIGTVKYGSGAHALVVERWLYRGNSLFAGYNTRQIFRPERSRHLEAGDPDDNPQGHYTMLDPHRAPWLWPHRCWRWRLSQWLSVRPRPFKWLQGLFAPRCHNGRLDFWMAEQFGPAPYKSPTWASQWSQFCRAGLPGPLGAVGGEVAGPEQPR